MSAAGPLAAAAAVVVAHRRPRELAELLAVLAATPASVTVVNAGDDPAVRDAAAVPGVRHLALPNEGYAAAVNAGARGGDRPVTIFMNDDVLPAPGSLARLAAAVLDGEADVALPRLLAEDGAEEGTARALPTPGRILLEWALAPDRPPPAGRGGGLVRKWRRPERPAAVEAGTAALVAVRAGLLAEEPLPEEYFLYWEELAWFWRLRSRGARVLLVPDAAVVHRHPAGETNPARERLLARNAVRCVRRTQGRGAALAALPAVWLWRARLLLQDGARALAGNDAARARIGARAAGMAAALGAWRELR